MKKQTKEKKMNTIFIIAFGFLMLASPKEQ